jgi:hypothetical protein
MLMGPLAPDECERIIAGMGPSTEPDHYAPGCTHGYHNLDQATGEWATARLAPLFLEYAKGGAYGALGAIHLHANTYHQGDGYDWHTDEGRGAVLSASVLLNGPHEYHGGQLEVATEGWPLEVPLIQGAVFVFMSARPHRVRPLLWGHRTILVCWQYPAGHHPWHLRPT